MTARRLMRVHAPIHVCNETVTRSTLCYLVSWSHAVPYSLKVHDCSSLLAELDEMANRWSANARLSLSEDELARYTAVKEALRELGQYECRIVRTPDGAGQYTVEFEPL